MNSSKSQSVKVDPLKKGFTIERFKYSKVLCYEIALRMFEVGFDTPFTSSFKRCDSVLFRKFTKPSSLIFQQSVKISSFKVFRDERQFSSTPVISHQVRLRICRFVTSSDNSFKVPPPKPIHPLIYRAVKVDALNLTKSENQASVIFNQFSLLDINCTYVKRASFKTMM